MKSLSDRKCPFCNVMIFHQSWNLIMKNVKHDFHLPISPGLQYYSISILMLHSAYNTLIRVSIWEKGILPEERRIDHHWLLYLLFFLRWPAADPKCTYFFCLLSTQRVLTSFRVFLNLVMRSIKKRIDRIVFISTMIKA